MYDYRCKDCENLGQNMPMASMPMKDMPIKEMPMKDTKDMSMMNMPMKDMPTMSMPMMIMPMMMMMMPMYDDDKEDEEDEDLKIMYPKIYTIIYPMVKNHCDMMESMYGIMHSPSKDEIDNMCKEVSDNYEKHYKDGDDEDMRGTFRQDRRVPIHDLARILFIRDLHERRRRRRRRRRRPMFHHGY
ncbi:hypothetical protein [Clostridium estertheticum]|uniref:Uncharacterized protein n=1 Tax=Clostridium estertheticum TaxID=238834 RepID=A0A7Y3WQR5_9CLOT|nr:hypothetical protein [Clostridium estertheticum]NNU75177.1 hypothetical protein [Clostridium estertheticum]WBL48351.1 hypothetical protein LOR37_06745 [Clostridium estertheticum]